MNEPDFLAVVDAEDGSIVHRMPMPNGRGRAASLRLESLQLGLPRAGSLASDRARLPLLADPHHRRRRRSAAAADREGHRARGDASEKTGLTRPHTVHCMPGENIVISMLGDADGNGTCGFAVLDAQTFEVKGRWENGGPHPPMNYDFWYQPRHNVLASSEFGEPNAYEGGFDPADVAAGRYGSRLHFWNLDRAPRRADARARRQRPGAARDPLAARSRRRPGLRRRRPVVARCGTSTARTAPTAPTR